jgi:ComF family protein
MPGNRKQNYLQHNKYNMSLFEQLFQIFTPHACVACEREGFVLCRDCAIQLPAPAHSLVLPQVSQLYAATSYTGAAKQALHLLKFERAGAAARDIAYAIVTHLPKECAGIVTHIPTAETRVRQRGYDQSRLIARQVAKVCQLPHASLLMRQGAQRQLGQSRTTRQLQMQTAFRARRAYMIENQSILLIDDVLTTGSTMTAAAMVLLSAGAKNVTAVVFATA